MGILTPDELAKCPRCDATPLADAIAFGAREERAKILRWLRRGKDSDFYDPRDRQAILQEADTIEAGWHCR